jgi:hypothetical protein
MEDRRRSGGGTEYASASGNVEKGKTVAVLLLVLVGCGGAEELTCEILEDPGNCWAAAAAAAAACLPPATEAGVLAADRESCSWSDGTRVVFEGPLPSATQELERLAFTIERGGAECASFVDTFMNRMELRAGGLGADSELHAGGEFHLHCLDGTDYEADFGLLFTCAPYSAPTDGFEVTPTSVSFTISAVTTPGELFRCEIATP